MSLVKAPLMHDDGSNSPEAETNAADRALTLAEAYLESGRTELAGREIHSALGARPFDERLHFMAGRIALVREEWDEACKAFEQSLELDPEQPGANCGLALALMNAGRRTEAEQAVLRALQLNAEFAWGYEVYARLLYETGHLKKARKLLAKSLELEPDSASAHQLLSVIEAERQDSEAAKRHADLGLAHAPDEASSHAAEAVRLYAAGHPFRARAAIREALRIEPDSAPLREFYADVDRSCRWIYLPMYYWSWLVARTPGGRVTIWFAFAALYVVRRVYKVESLLLDFVVLGYVILMLYTWVADMLVALWIRLRPAR